MATKTKETKQKPASKKAFVLRGRVEPELKQRVGKHCEQIERSESWLIRRAVEDFLERQAA